MIIGVLEYGEVRLFEDEDQLLREWGSYSRDVESGVIVFYDADGVWLEPIVTPSPRRWLGLKRGAETFTLRRNCAPDPSVDPIGVALAEATSLVSSRHVSSLDDLRKRFPFVDPSGRTGGV